MWESTLLSLLLNAGCYLTARKPRSSNTLSTCGGGWRVPMWLRLGPSNVSLWLTSLLNGTKIMAPTFNNSIFTVCSDGVQWWGQPCLGVGSCTVLQRLPSAGGLTSAATLVSFHFVGLVFQVFVIFHVLSINYLLIKTSWVSFCCLHSRTPIWYKG